jgi:carbonic anhydrase/acetyltransferase-like protein (isoleucine patch superfamily)
VEPAGIRLGDQVTIEPLAVLMGHPEGELEVGDGTLIGAHASCKVWAGCVLVPRSVWEPGC